MNFQKKDKLRGMLWGLIVGDCLGAPIQFSEKNAHMHITEMTACAHFGTPPGYWTDDSAMAFCVMESFARLQKYNLVDIGNNFVRWLRTGFCSSLPYAFDVGHATSYAGSQIAAGNLRNGSETSQGNGRIMRFAPSYLISLSQGEEKIIYEISDLTHNSAAVRKVVNRMKRVCDAHLGTESNRPCRTRINSPYHTRAEVNNSGWAVSTLDAALWAFHSTKTFEDGMVAAVNLGGDSDSIGAVYGQIAGLFYGCAAIPERWIAAVKERKKVDEFIERFLTACDAPKKNKVISSVEKWEPVFLHCVDFREVEDSTFAEDCWALGFDMDSGKSLKEKFPEAELTSPDGLKKIISEINDVRFLGTAVFSCWRGLTHWSGVFLGFSEENKAWFKIAFDRIRELVETMET